MNDGIHDPATAGMGHKFLNEAGSLPQKRAPLMEQLPSPTPTNWAGAVPPVADPMKPSGERFFNCPTCKVQLFSSGSDLPGLCPNCGMVIPAFQIQPLAVVPLVSLTAVPPNHAVESNLPFAEKAAGANYPAAVNTLSPLPSVTSPMPSATPAPWLAPAAIDSEHVTAPTGNRPQAKKFHRTGNFVFKKLDIDDIPVREPDFERAESDADTGIAPPLAMASSARTSMKKIWVYIGILLVVGFIVVLLMRENTNSARRAKEDSSSVQVQTPDALRKTLQTEAWDTLNLLASATSPADVSGLLIGARERGGEIEARFGKNVFIMDLSDEDVTSVLPLSDDEYRRGMFAMVFQAAPKIDLHAMRPILPAEITTGVSPMGLLEATAFLASQTDEAPRRSLMFFKKTNQRLQLDWDLYVQTHERTLEKFIDGELGEGPFIFRVAIARDVLVFENGETVGNIVYRLQDPLHSDIKIRVLMYPYDPVAAMLRCPPHVLDKDPSAEMRPRNVTLELRRNMEKGTVSIEKFICNEFLGIGGT